CIRHSELGGPPDRRIDCARIPSGTYAVLVFRSHAVWNCADTECRRCAQDGSCTIGEFVGTLNRRFTFHRFESVEGSRLLQRRDGGRNSWSAGESEWPACRCAAIFLLVQGQRNRAQRNRGRLRHGAPMPTMLIYRVSFIQTRAPRKHCAKALSFSIARLRKIQNSAELGRE